MPKPSAVWTPTPQDEPRACLEIDMPKSCDVCTYSETACIRDIDGFLCRLVYPYLLIDRGIAEIGRHPDCPLKPVPEDSSCVNNAQVAERTISKKEIIPEITLRDYFAAAALTGISKEIMNPKLHTTTIFAKQAYDLADAMLSERDKKSE